MHNFYFSNYPQPPTSFDYAGLGTGVSSSTATSGLKHWSAIDQFATAPLLSSAVATNEMLLSNFQSVANEAVSANVVLSSLDRNETSSANIVRDVQSQQTQAQKVRSKFFIVNRHFF